MNILFLTSNRGKICGLSLGKPLHLLAMFGILGLMLSGAGYIGYSLNPNQENQALIDEWQADVRRHQVQLQNIREEAEAKLPFPNQRQILSRVWYDFVDHEPASLLEIPIDTE